MSNRQDQSLLESIVTLAKNAGDAILEHYSRPPEAHLKADLTPVTAADTASEAVILAGLARIAPAIPVVSEEKVSEGVVPDISGGRFFLVDPLDGTREYLNRNGEFTVNIALVENMVPVLGVVHAPALGLTFFAHGPGTATEERGGTRKSIRVRAPDESGLVVVGSRSHGNPEALAAYLRGRKVASVIPAGSAIKFGRVAAGEADLYPRFGRTMEWDTAAGQAVVEAAGGAVETLDGNPLRYRKPGFANPEFVARGLRGAGG